MRVESWSRSTAHTTDRLDNVDTFQEIQNRICKAARYCWIGDISSLSCTGKTGCRSFRGAHNQRHSPASDFPSRTDNELRRLQESPETRDLARYCWRRRLSNRVFTHCQFLD